MLYIEYSKVEKLRFDFIASQEKRPDQFTVWKLSKTHTTDVSCGRLQIPVLCSAEELEVYVMEWWHNLQ